jgi:V/A-type H+-transporting ATPase subunit K
MNSKRGLLLFMIGIGALLFGGALLLLATTASALAQTGADAAAGAAPVDAVALQWAMLSAALAVAASSLAAGYAVARVGSAGVGAITEKPELMGRILVFVGLAEGIAIYGLIVAILILNRVA